MKTLLMILVVTLLSGCGIFGTWDDVTPAEFARACMDVGYTPGTWEHDSCVAQCVDTYWIYRGAYSRARRVDVRVDRSGNYAW